MINDDKRMAGCYEIIHSLHIGDKEVVFGENKTEPSEAKYMCAYCKTNDLFRGYEECLAGDDYLEIMELYTERLMGQIEAVKAEISEKQIPIATITAEQCRKDDLSKSILRVRVYGDYHLSKVTWKGLRALYYFYRRKLREACRQQSSYTPYVLRDDIRSLEAVDRQTRFLFKNRIDTEEELTFYRDHAGQRIVALSTERSELKNELRRTGVPVQRFDEIKSRIGKISTELKTLRQDMKLCDAIAVRSLEIAERSAQLSKGNPLLLNIACLFHNWHL